MLDLANRRYTSIVDVEAILHMHERARVFNSEILVRFAPDLRPNDLKSCNVILLGASTADPLVELFEKDMNFVLQDDYMLDRAVLNRRPLNGEPDHWAFPHGNPNRDVFGVVAYRPNLDVDRLCHGRLPDCSIPKISWINERAYPTFRSGPNHEQSGC